MSTHYFFKRFFGLLLLMTLSVEVIAQEDPYIDSLKNVLNTTRSDSVKAYVLNTLANEIWEESVWTKYNQRALNLANKKLETATGNDRNFYLGIKAQSVSNQGFYYDDHGDKSKALELYFESLDIYNQTTGLEHEIAGTYGNIGIILTDQRNFKEAEDYLQKALEMKLKHAPEEAAFAYINLGACAGDSGDSEKALGYYQDALKIAEKYQHINALATSYNNIGAIYFRKKEYQAGIDYTHEALKFYRMDNDPSGIAWAMANLGQNFFHIGEKDSAFFYNSQAMELATELGYPEIMANAADNLHYIYADREEWKQSLKYFKLYSKMSDSLYNIDVQKDALRRKMDFDKKMDDAQRQAEQDRMWQAVYFLIGGAGMVIIFAIIIYSRLRITRNQKKTIETQKEEIEETNREIVDSINYAKRLQDAILPGKQEMLSQFADAFLMYKPKDIVAGDFYWMYREGNTIYVAAADCTGHGVPGAMVSVVCANALDRAVKEFALSDTGKVLDKVTELVVQTFEKSSDDVKDGMDISLCKVDLETGDLMFSGANNPLWVYRHQDKVMEVIKGDRQPVGKYDDLQPFKSNTLKLSNGDWVYQFSDGYADQFGGDQGKKFKSGSLKKMLSEMEEKSGTERLKIAQNTFESWKGELEQLDDICLIGWRL